MKRLLSLSALVLLLGAPSNLRAQSAPALFQQALRLERSQGDIPAALAVYRQVTESVTASRQDVARALLAMGRAQELMGSDEAHDAYSRLVSEFSDQPAAFLEAQSRLAQLAELAPSPAPDPASRHEYTLLVERLSDAEKDGRNPRQHDISPDGRTMVLSARTQPHRMDRQERLARELYLITTGSTVYRPLYDDPVAAGLLSMGLPRWAPDGRTLMFRAWTVDDEGAWILYDLEAGEELYRGNGSNFRHWEWMPNSKEFIVQQGPGFRVFDRHGELIRELDAGFVGRSGMGGISPDGRHVAYFTKRPEADINEELDIWIMDVETGERTRITNDEGPEYGPVWSRDGSALYYVAGEGSVRNLYRKRLGSDGPPEQVTSFSNAAVSQPLVIHETGQLVFSLSKENHTIMIASADRVEAPREVIRGRSPLLSPDGETVYYLDDEPGRMGLWSASVRGENPRHLVAGVLPTRNSVLPYLSPDGRRLAYFLREGERTNLYVQASVGGERRLLYSRQGAAYHMPAWSPDGSEIAFADGGDMMVVSPDGGAPTVLARTDNWESWTLKWSPDGRSIAAFGYTGEGEQNILYVVDRKTGEMRRLTPPSDDFYKEVLDWHPDGDRLSYMTYDWMNSDGNGSKIVSLSGGEPQLFATMPDPYWDYIGIWGPDERYYFVSAGGPRVTWGLYATDGPGSTVEPIRVASEREVWLPTWSRDGSIMAWSESEATRQLWMLEDYE